MSHSRFADYSDIVANETESQQDPTEHSLLEDAYAMLTGCIMVALGLVLMKNAGIVTAGVAGIALLISYHVPYGVGLLFLLLNIPFLLLAATTLGREFCIKTTVAIVLIFALAAMARLFMTIEWIHPAFAALAGGTLVGGGILALVRHKTGVGGVNVVAVWAQKTRGWNVGRMSMVLDGVILLVAAFSLTVEQMLWSVLSVLAINLVLVAYHKPERYLGHSRE